MIDACATGIAIIDKVTRKSLSDRRSNTYISIVVVGILHLNQLLSTFNLVERHALG